MTAVHGPYHDTAVVLWMWGCNDGDMCSLLFALVAMATGGQLAVIPVPLTPLPHIRPLDLLAADLVATGARASSTFTHLVEALDRAPGLIVYVSTTSQPNQRGSIVFVSRGSSVTYLLVRVGTHQAGADRVAVLAHELEHAVEISQSFPPITSDADLQRLYAGIGLDSGGKHRESSAAVRAERAVNRELAKHKRLPESFSIRPAIFEEGMSCMNGMHVLPL